MPLDALTVVQRAPGYVLGLLIMSELGWSPTKIAKRVGAHRGRVAEVLAVARTVSAWGVEANRERDDT